MTTNTNTRTGDNGSSNTGASSSNTNYATILPATSQHTDPAAARRVNPSPVLYRNMYPCTIYGNSPGGRPMQTYDPNYTVDISSMSGSQIVFWVNRGLIGLLQQMAQSSDVPPQSKRPAIIGWWVRHGEEGKKRGADPKYVATFEERKSAVEEYIDGWEYDHQWNCYRRVE